MSRFLDRSPVKSVASALAAALVAFGSMTATSHAEPIELVSSVWCDTAEQVESVYRAHYADGTPIEAAVAQANSKASRPAACAAVTALVVDAGEARRFVAGNQMMSLSRFVVVGFVKDGRAMQIRPQMQFTGKVIAKLMAI